MYELALSRVEAGHESLLKVADELLGSTHPAQPLISGIRLQDPFVRGMRFPVHQTFAFHSRDQLIGGLRTDAHRTGEVGRGQTRLVVEDEQGAELRAVERVGSQPLLLRRVERVDELS